MKTKALARLREVAIFISREEALPIIQSLKSKLTFLSNPRIDEAWIQLIGFVPGTKTPSEALEALSKELKKLGWTDFKKNPKLGRNGFTFVKHDKSWPLDVLIDLSKPSEEGVEVYLSLEDYDFTDSSLAKKELQLLSDAAKDMAASLGTKVSALKVVPQRSKPPKRFPLTVCLCAKDTSEGFDPQKLEEVLRKEGYKKAGDFYVKGHVKLQKAAKWALNFSMNSSMFPRPV